MICDGEYLEERGSNRAIQKFCAWVDVIIGKLLTRTGREMRSA